MNKGWFKWFARSVGLKIPIVQSSVVCVAKHLVPRKQEQQDIVAYVEETSISTKIVAAPTDTLPTTSVGFMKLMTKNNSQKKRKASYPV